MLDFRPSDVTYYLTSSLHRTKDYEIKIYKKYFGNVDKMLTLKTFTDLAYAEYKVIFWMGFQFFVFIFYFCSPLYLILYFDTDRDITRLHLLICLGTQMFLILLELTQLHSRGFKDYFSDLWNLQDIALFFMFLIYFYISWDNPLQKYCS